MTKSSRLEPLSDLFRAELRRLPRFGELRGGSACSGGDASSTVMTGVFADRGLVEKDEGARATASSSLLLLLGGATRTGNFGELSSVSVWYHSSVPAKMAIFSRWKNLVEELQKKRLRSGSP